MAKVESADDNLYDGLYGDEFEEDFALSGLGNPSTITDSTTDDADAAAVAEFIEPLEDVATSAFAATATASALEPEATHPIPTYDSSIRPPPRTSAGAVDVLPPKPHTLGSGNTAGGVPLSYSAQVAEQFSSSYRQTPSQERGRLDAARLAQFNQPSGGNTTAGASLMTTTTSTAGAVDGQARPVRPSEMKDEGKMFVGGLSWDTTDEGLRNYFSEFGKVDACTIVRDADGKSRGFAFLTFEDPASVNAVMVREHFLDGKAIDPKRAIPREEHLRNTRYFVGGLAPQTTADSMRAFFSQFGKVVDATVMVDRETGRSKGFGFVTFEDNSNDSQLVGKLGLVLDDKQIEVKTAQPRSQRDQQRQNAVPPNNFNNGQVAGGNTAPMGTSMPFMTMNNTGAGDMSMMYQRMMNGMGTPYGAMMGGGMGMMGGFNPMMGMGMGMGRFGMGGMGGMGGGGAVAGMNSMAGAANMGSGMGGMGGGAVGGMRLGMGPIGMAGGNAAGMGGMVAGGMGAAAMGAGGGMGMGGIGGMRQGMGGMMGAGAGAGAGRGRPGMNQGPGPARVTNRGQHGFHPYAR